MKRLLLIAALIILAKSGFSTGEPSTYFNIFVPPNNDPVKRNVCLIVTAIYDSTYFDIIDDGMDGDTDDSKTGWLMAGQSYVLYIADNGINDDARYASGGVWKQDGDYFIIKSSKLVYASQSTNSDWQFDFVPSVSKSSVGKRFIVYSPPTSFSNRDLNVFAYENNTTVTIRKISKEPTIITSKTVIDWENASIVAQRTLNPGEDIIHYYTDGRNVMESGETYMIEANKDISLQYGALWQNSRDGGGYVPSSNGSSSGELFYFVVPYQAQKEQEIRIVSWEDSNQVSLSRYQNGNWISMKNWTVDAMKSADWVGKTENGTYSNVFRITTSPGKKVSVSIANWLETGSPGTSDIATMASAENGSTSGKRFLQYMAPPGKEHNVTDPFTGQKFNGNFTHLYLFASDSATVVVKDAYTNGQDYYKTFSIPASRYADCALSLTEWRNIYNGDGKASSGPERPYLYVTSDVNISVMNTNFNDNWMMYFGTSLEQGFTQVGSSSATEGSPGDTVKVLSRVENNPNDTITDISASILVSTGGIPVKGTALEVKSNSTFDGTIVEDGESSRIVFDSLPDLAPTDSLVFVTEVILSSSDNSGEPLPPSTVVSVETSLIGRVNNQIQQSVVTEGISNNTDDNSHLWYSLMDIPDLSTRVTDSWTSNWVDFDGDGDDDLFVTTKSGSAGNFMYRNDGASGFVSVSLGKLTSNKRITVSSCWGDLDGDGDLDVVLVNDTRHPSEVYINNQGNFTRKNNSGMSTHPEYFHGGSLADYDRDGDLDLVLINYMPTKFHALYKNDGSGKFKKVENSPVSSLSSYSVSANWIDINNDGWTDLFIPNGEEKANSLFINKGGRFEIADGGDLTTDALNSIGAAWGDYNNDGWIDVLVTNASENNVQLFKNSKNGTFAKVVGIFDNKPGQYHGCVWLDADNDADLDLYFTDDQGAKYFYVNMGNDSFRLKREEALNSNYGKSYGISVSDYNGDGYPDVFVATHGNEKNALFKHNGGLGNSWSKIRLEGSVSNSTALGARLRLKCNGKWQHRQLTNQDGMGGNNSLDLHFGLDSASAIDSLVIFWPSGYVQVLTNQRVESLLQIQEPASSSVSGRVFADYNNNCVRDSGEVFLSGMEVNAGAGLYKTYTDSEGRFKLRLDAGTHSLAATGTNWSSTCTATQIVFGTVPADSSGVELALNPSMLGADLHVELSSNYWRRGFGSETHLTVGNTGTTPALNAVVKVEYPVGFYLNDASRSYSSSTDHYEFNIDTLYPGQTLKIALLDSVGLVHQTGDELTISAQISSDDQELDDSDNQTTYTQEIVGAIDPNDIAVSPEGYIPVDQELLYTIRFQNVGTFMATRVYIECQLPSGLNFESVKTKSMSHDGLLNIDANGLLTWEFNGINLPDSNSNEKASHGRVEFSVFPEQSLRPGDILLNNAEIYFDYEEAVKTNVVENIILDEFDGVRPLRIYPNPVRRGHKFKVSAGSYNQLEAPALRRIEIYTSAQELILLEEGDAKEVVLQLKDQRAGTYFIIAYDHLDNVYSGKVMIQ